MTNRKWAELITGILMIIVGGMFVVNLTFTDMIKFIGVALIVGGVFWLIGK